MLWPISRFRYRTPGGNHYRGQRQARLRRLGLLWIRDARLRRHLRGPRLIDHHALPRPVSLQVPELVLERFAAAAAAALGRVDDGAGPAGAVGGGAFGVAAAAGEDGEGVHDHAGLLVGGGGGGGFGLCVFVDGEADVVCDEADGEGVEEGFQEGEAAGYDAVVCVDDGDELGFEGGFGQVGGVEGTDEVDEAEDGERNGPVGALEWERVISTGRLTLDSV